MSSNQIENVLVLQGGGSLGAFACGVFKALANKNIKVDIVAGTSIGGINAAIISWQCRQRASRTHARRVLVRTCREFCKFDSSHTGVAI